LRYEKISIDILPLKLGKLATMPSAAETALLNNDGTN
jgi:hypothetical protein